VNLFYTLYVCPSCGEHYIFSGSCDDDGSKLVARRVIPVSIIEEFRDSYIATSSPVPRWFIEHFVKSLLAFTSARKKSLEEINSDR
jgi:intein-encoded DNA endonuclease-like protein